MRSMLVLLFVLSVVAYPGLSYALEPTDTVATWKNAPAADKNKVVTELLKADGTESRVANVIECVDKASDVAGHAELSISEVVNACNKDGSEPV